MSWTAPNGMLKRIVLNWSKPKASMIKGPNVEIPPLGRLVLSASSSSSKINSFALIIRDCKHQSKPEPCFQIQTCFSYMVPFPFVVFDALLVHSESISLDLLLQGFQQVYLSIATNFSSSFRNLALTGESGMKSLDECQHDGHTS